MTEVLLKDVGMSRAMIPAVVEILLELYEGSNAHGKHLTYLCCYALCPTDLAFVISHS